MDIKITPASKSPASVVSNKPAFTAQLKGNAVKMAVKNAVDAFQIGEVTEILENVRYLGDSATRIDCNADGLVSVSNQKFGNLVHKFKLRKNDKSNNPYLEFLREFNSNNGILRVEHNFFGFIFGHIKSPAMKEAKYKLYSSLPMSSATMEALNNTAKQHGIIKMQKSPEDDAVTLERFKEAILKVIDKQNNV